MSDERPGDAGALTASAMLNLLEDLRDENEARKRGERELRAAESRYRQLFELSPDGIVILDPETTKPLEFNEMAHLQLGYTREEFARLSLRDIDVHETPEDTRGHVDRILADGRDDFETRHRTRQGEIRNVQVTAQIMEILGARVYYCIWRDITLRKKAEERLRESEENMRYIIKHDPNAIAVYDRGLRYIAVSDRYLRDYGVKEEDIIGRHHYEVFPEMPQRWKEVHQRCLAGAIERNDDDSFERPDGSITYNRWECRPWRRVDGSIGGIITYTEVTTERKMAEEALRASLKEKETLLREIHHRVKNNMQIISSLFNLQAGHIKDADALRSLKEGQNRIRSMALIHEKLYKSRDLSKVEFASYIRSLSTYLFQFFKVDPDRVRLETDLQDILLDINSAIPCGLLINELISNALKHAFPEGRRGVISVGLRREEDGRLRLRVADDGVGLPGGLDLRTPGSFGLQIVDLLINQLDGEVELDGKKGTSITISFRQLEYKIRT